MTDRPILFSESMVFALLDGRKTQTRRVMKLPTRGEYVHPDLGGWTPATIGGDGSRLKDGTPAPKLMTIWNQTTGTSIASPFQAGDRLWVREAWRSTKPYDDLSPSDLSGEEPIRYEADGNRQSWGAPTQSAFGRLRSSIHMPRWASRLTLTVTDVRIERLQAICEADAIAEGCFKGKASGRVFDTAAGMHFGGAEWASARDWYADLWDTIHGEGAWEANPWVVALTFTVHRGNIDEVSP